MKAESLCKAELFHRVSTRCLLVIILCFVATQLSLSGPSAAAALLRRSTDCRRNATEIVFLAFYPPCAKEARSSSELERLEQCDLLTEAAIESAVERINQNPANILPEGATLRVLPIRFEDEKGANTYDNMIMVSHQCNRLVIHHYNIISSAMVSCTTL